MIENQNIANSCDRLELIINNILDLIIEMDFYGNYTFVSPQSVQILGYEPEELIGHKSIEFIHPDDLKTFIDLMNDPIAYDVSHTFKFRLKHKNGNYIHVSVKGVILNQNDETKHIVVIRDISKEIIAEKKARESEQHYRKIIESIGDPIQVVDSNMQIIMANSTFKKWINLYGISSEIMGKTPFELFPFLPEKVADLYEHVFETGQTFTSEECINIDGQEIYVESRKIPILTSGKVNQIITVLRDITEKKISDQYFIESEEKFKNIANQSFMSIAILQNGVIKYFNKRVSEINGYSTNEIKNWKPFEFLKIIHPDDRDFVLTQAKKKQTGELDAIEQYKYRLIRKDGEIRWIELFSKPINYRGNPAVLAMSIEITDKIIAEKKLKDSEANYRLITENSNDLVRVLNEDFQIEFFNEETHMNVLGYSKEEILNKTDLFFNHPDDYKHINRFMLRVFKKGEGFHESRLRHKNGTYIWFEVKIKCFRDEKEHQKYLLVYRDINERKGAEQNLKNSEEKYRNLFEDSPFMIFLIDLKGKILDLNQTALESLTYQKEDLVGKNFSTFDIMQDKNLSSLAKMYKNVLKNEFLEPFQINVNSPTVKPTWMEIQAKIVKFDEKKYIQVIIEDISEKKKAEEMLKESEKKYQNIIENTKEAIVIIDLKGKLQYVSPQLSRILKGIKIKKSSRFFLNIHKDDVQGIISYYENAIKEKSVSDKVLEFRILNKEQNYIWLSSTSKNYYDDNGRIIGFITSLKDISDKKIAQQRLRESEYQYRHLFENSPNAIVVTDKHGFVLDQNFAVERIFGISRHESIGKHFSSFDIFDSTQISLLKARVQKIINGEILKPISLKVRNRFGKDLWILYQTSIVHIDEKIIIESIVEDITERKKAEEIIKTENSRLLELNKLKSDLITRVSHELKTPLNSIYGGAQILLNLYQDKTSAEANEFIQMIHKGGSRLKLLIENILDISRIESNKLKLDLREENIVEIIKECTEELKYTLNERQIDITVTLPKESYIRIDKLRIGQVFINILSNAIKSTPPNGVIEVNLKETEDSICVSIQDTGVGLSLDDMNKLFKQFGKIERYGQKLGVDIEGSGLGLFISKEIIDLHGGTIWTESEGRNKGATFKIKLFKNIG